VIQSEQLKGEVRIQWYEDGRMTFSLPNDPSIAYFMLHAALDDIQERMMVRKAAHLRRTAMETVPKDGASPAPDWGR